MPTQPKVYPYISATLVISDSIGFPKHSFPVGEQFMITFDIMNLTGKPQLYTLSDPICDIAIWSGDSIVASFTRYLPARENIWRDTLWPNHGKGSGWFAPIMPGSTCCFLAPGNYTATATPIIRFDSVAIEKTDDVTFTITP